MTYLFFILLADILNKFWLTIFSSNLLKSQAFRFHFLNYFGWFWLQYLIPSLVGILDHTPVFFIWSFILSSHLQLLAMAYGTLKESYEKVVAVMESGKRMLGRYYRVAFYGRVSETKSNKTISNKPLNPRWHKNPLLCTIFWVKVKQMFKFSYFLRVQDIKHPHKVELGKCFDFVLLQIVGRSLLFYAPKFL